MMDINRKELKDFVNFINYKTYRFSSRFRLRRVFEFPNIRFYDSNNKICIRIQLQKNEEFYAVNIRNRKLINRFSIFSTKELLKLRNNFDDILHFMRI